MTVVRGDAARRLIARRRATSGHPPPLGPARPWSATMRSPHDHGSADTASRFVAQVLTDHGMVDRVPDATAVIQELVENARQHGRGVVETSISLCQDGRLMLEVADEGPSTPALRSAPNRGRVDHSGETGRAQPQQPGSGLKLVALLSQAWGVRDVDQGKIVWVQLHDHDVRCRGCHQL